MKRHLGWLALGFIALALVGGCVERRLKVTTNPPGALVLINDEEVGPSPVTFSFLWYGDYDIIVRKPGYETLKTHYRIDAPWYQWPGVDFFTEVLWPGQIVDKREIPTLELAKAENPSQEEILQRAVELRERAIYSD